MARGRPGKSSDDVLLKSAELIGWALGGLEREILQTRERLAALTDQATQLRGRLGRRASASADAAPGGESGEGAGRRARRRKMSVEARRRISEMMKKRWAERRKRTA
jgi:hypothetical protein